MPHWYFFSYARRDKDELLEQFHRDLAVRVAKAVAWDGEPAQSGFFDTQTLQMGDLWQEVLRDALQTSRIMVCNVTPYYCNSDFCGKEFDIFRRRRAAAGAARTSRVILPVLWEKMDELPQALTSEIQLDDDGFPDVYKKRGLRWMMDTDAKREYKLVLNELVQRIRTNGKVVLPPLDDFPDYADIKENPFKPPRRSGRLSAAFFFSDGWSWRPYDPPDPLVAGALAQEISARHLLPFEDIEQGGGSVARLREAADARQAVMLVLNPRGGWTAEFDQILGRDNCDVVLASPDTDPAALPPRLAARLPGVARTPKEFRDELDARLAALKSRITGINAEAREATGSLPMVSASSSG